MIGFQLLDNDKVVVNNFLLEVLAETKEKFTGL